MKALIKIFSLILIVGCQQSLFLPTIQYADSFDTSDKQVDVQVKKVYDTDSLVLADNLFDGARLNGFDRLNDSTFNVIILPENEPINPSPWYAFRIWSKQTKQIYLRFEYGKYKHRYYPKLSKNGEIWAKADSVAVIPLGTERTIILKLKLNQGDTTWVAGQDIISSKDVEDWARDKAEQGFAQLKKIGVSREQRPLWLLNIDPKGESDKPALVVMSRQHPPEVTGYKAMEYFVEELLGLDSLANAFRNKFRVMVFPNVNPDGVDMGHWRHSAGGVDLNRDWAGYEQPEVKQIAKFIHSQSTQNAVIMGIDFHSTYRDVFYTNDTLSSNQTVRDQWFEYMESQIAGYQVNEKPSAVKRPVSKSWFFSLYGVEGITYEVGDSTPEEFIEQKGRISARAVMKVLLEFY